MPFFDAGRILELGSTGTIQVPEGRFGMSFGAWSFNDICKAKPVNGLIKRDCRWFWTSEPFAQKKLDAGNCIVRLPIPGSRKKTRNLDRFLAHREKPGTFTLAAIYLLCCQIEGLPDPLDGGWLEVLETNEEGDGLGFRWENGKLSILQYARESMSRDNGDEPWHAGVLLI